MAHGKASELAMMPKLRLMYVPREVAPRTRRPNAVCAMRPPSMEPTGSKLSACVVSAHHPAMKYGCTSTPFVLASKKSCEMPPSKRLVLNNESGMGIKSGLSPPTESVKPYTNRFNATILPASGPAAATSNKSARVSGVLLICVSVPNVPSCEFGIKNGTPILILRINAAI